MTWADEIQVAMVRGKSPYTAADVLRWLRNGDAWMGVTPNLHASLWFRDGICEVGHMFGRWTKEDAEWLRDAAWREMRKRGITEMQVNGRKGWKRFWKLKGFENVSQW